MRRIKTVIAMLLSALFVMSVIAPAAFGEELLPEFRTKEGNAFTYMTKAVTVIETVAGQKIECANERAHGTGAVNGVFETNEIIKVTLLLTGCDYANIMEPCTGGSAEANTGELFLATAGSQIKGEIEYINKPMKEVGLILNTGGGELKSFTCEQKKITVKIKGAFVGPIGPINQFVTSAEHFTIKNAQVKGVQSPKNFPCPDMGKKEAQLMVSISTVKGGAFEEAGISGTFEMAPEKGEIKILA
jgi:hypothetical protein